MAIVVVSSSFFVAGEKTASTTIEEEELGLIVEGEEAILKRIVSLRGHGTFLMIPRQVCEAFQLCLPKLGFREDHFSQSAISFQ